MTGWSSDDHEERVDWQQLGRLASSAAVAMALTDARVRQATSQDELRLLSAPVQGIECELRREWVREEAWHQTHTESLVCDAYPSQLDVAIVVADSQPSLRDRQVGDALPDLVRCRFGLLIYVLQVQLDFLLS